MVHRLICSWLHMKRCTGVFPETAGILLRSKVARRQADKFAARNGFLAVFPSQLSFFAHRYWTSAGKGFMVRALIPGSALAHSNRCAKLNVLTGTAGMVPGSPPDTDIDADHFVS